ncbi:MAG: translation elongation factor-like protein [Chloroflexi bacterium]|nr:translation elongation factor-like protein [Chloroflexota bacterium]
MPEEEIGKVDDYFAHVGAAGIQLTGTLKLGDAVHILGHSTDLEIKVDSLQINNVPVTEGKAGQAVGIKVPGRVHRGDRVYKVVA